MAIRRKVGRTAHENVRDQANELAALYRAIYECPDEQFCINPDDNPDEHLFTDVRQALGHVVAHLESFSETGQFGSQINMQTFSIREHAEMLKKQGMLRVHIIAKLVERYAVSQSVIERAIRKNSKSTASDL